MIVYTAIDPHKKILRMALHPFDPNYGVGSGKRWEVVYPYRVVWIWLEVDKYWKVSCRCEEGHESRSFFPTKEWSEACCLDEDTTPHALRWLLEGEEND